MNLDFNVSESFKEKLIDEGEDFDIFGFRTYDTDAEGNAVNKPSKKKKKQQEQTSSRRGGWDDDNKTTEEGKSLRKIDYNATFESVGTETFSAWKPTLPRDHKGNILEPRPEVTNFKKQQSQPKRKPLARRQPRGRKTKRQRSRSYSRRSIQKQPRSLPKQNPLPPKMNLAEERQYIIDRSCNRLGISQTSDTQNAGSLEDEAIEKIIMTMAGVVVILVAIYVIQANAKQSIDTNFSVARYAAQTENLPQILPTDSIFSKVKNINLPKLDGVWRPDLVSYGGSIKRSFNSIANNIRSKTADAGSYLGLHF